jgi:hypothetical protein
MRRIALVVVLGVIVGIGAAAWLRRGAPSAATDNPAAATVKTEHQKRTEEIFAANVSLPGDPELASAYQAINAEYFDNRLPAVRLRWESRLDEVGPMIADNFRMGGVTDGKTILLNPAIQEDGDEFRRVLCHEMVHVAVPAEREAHGPIFQHYLKQLADRGAFRGLVASEEEKRQRRVALERKIADLSAEVALLGQMKAALEAEAASGSPGADLPERTTAYNDRVRRHNDAVVQFNRDVDEYNLMVTYPDGLDEERLARKTSVG